MSQIHTLPLFFQLNTGFVKINSGAKVIGQIYKMVHSAVFKNRENRRRKNRNNIGWCIQYLWENRRKLFWKKLKWRHWKSKNIVRLYKLFSQGGDYFQVCPCFAGDTVVCVGKKYTKRIQFRRLPGLVEEVPYFNEGLRLLDKQSAQWDTSPFYMKYIFLHTLLVKWEVDDTLLSWAKSYFLFRCCRWEGLQDIWGKKNAVRAWAKKYANDEWLVLGVCLF